jgi:excisionase family DNA binding protein
MGDLTSEFLTTRELAELLHIKERKVYDLASSGKVPCSRATGKLLFPRRAIEQWMAEHSSGGTPVRSHRQSQVVLGSQDPLLEWALRASGADLATLLDGSLDGLERFAHGDGQAAALHIYDPQSGGWNVPAVRARFERAPVALLEFAWRQRGLVVAPGAESRFPDLKSVAGVRLVPRQGSTGSQVLLTHLLADAGVPDTDIDWTETAPTETDAAIAVLEEKADAALGLQAMAQQLRLGFVPLVRERFDLLVDRAAWFDPPLQRLFAFCRSEAFAGKAAEFSGYAIGGLGTVHFNGA